VEYRRAEHIRNQGVEACGLSIQMEISGTKPVAAKKRTNLLNAFGARRPNAPAPPVRSWPGLFHRTARTPAPSFPSPEQRLGPTSTNPAPALSSSPISSPATPNPGGGDIQSIEIVSLPAHGTLTLTGSPVTAIRHRPRVALQLVLPRLPPVTPAPTASPGTPPTASPYAAAPRTENLTISPHPHLSIAGSKSSAKPATDQADESLRRHPNGRSEHTVHRELFDRRGTAIGRHGLRSPPAARFGFHAGQTTATISGAGDWKLAFRINKTFQPCSFPTRACRRSFPHRRVFTVGKFSL